MSQAASMWLRGREMATVAPEGACPFHAVARIMEARKRRGFSEKQPLLCTRSGQAVTMKGLMVTLREVTGVDDATEHCERRSGAQFYARKGVPLWVIQFSDVGAGPPGCAMWSPP